MPTCVSDKKKKKVMFPYVALKIITLKYGNRACASASQSTLNSVCAHSVPIL